MRVIGVLIFTWLFCQFSASRLIAQDYSWKNYSVAEGMPQTQVITMMQDSDGLLWLATKNGFSIFDGIEFENYSSKDGLDFDEVDRFQEVSKGVFYIGTRSGLSIMTHKKITQLFKDFPHGVLFQLADGDGNFWFRFPDSRLILYDSGDFSTSHPVFDLLESGEFLNHVILPKADKRLVFSSSFGNVFFAEETGFTKIQTGIPNMTLLEGADGDIYGYTSNSLYHYRQGRFTRIFEQERNYKLLHINSPDDFYITEMSSMRDLIHVKDGREEQFPRQFSLISSVLIDDEGTFWLGSDSGLWQLQSRGFRNYLADPDNNFYTWTVLQDRSGDYLFGSYLHQLKKLKGDTFTDIPLKKFYGTNPFSFYSGGIKKRDGDLLVPTSIGVLSYDGAKLEWFYDPNPYATIMYIYDDREHNKYLLAASNQGLVEIDDAGKAKAYNDRLPTEHTELITSILRDKYDRIWISGKKGVSIRENDRWRHLPDDKDSIPIGAISMLMDSAQNIWLGSNDGLYFYDYTSLKKIAPDVFTTQIGVLNTTNANELVVGTINGLGIVDLHDFYLSGKADVRFFDHNTGWQGVECKHNSSFKDDQGNIWICTSNRVVKVIPQELKTNPRPPKVFIKSISATWAAKELGQIHRIVGDTLALVFHSRQEDLRFNYHAISLSAPNGVKYRTMLDGYDVDWSAETKERYRTYTNLPHGQYTFKVQACNFDGVWTQQAAETTFTISPAWHELLSVKISGVLVIAAIAAGIGYLFSERKRKKRLRDEQAEKNIAKLQFKSLKGMIDPHFTFNAINSIASMVYSQNRDEAYGYFTKFSRLIRNVFEHAERTTRTLEDEMDFVTNYLDIEKMRFGNKFDYTVTTSSGLNIHMEIPKLLIQIYVENAIKHGLMAMESGGKLEVMLGEQNKQLEIVIRDNGIGRRQSQKTKNGNYGLGKGTKIIQQYFDLLNRFNERKIVAETTDLTDGNDQPAGTEVRITIPYDFKYTL